MVVCLESIAFPSSVYVLTVLLVTCVRVAVYIGFLYAGELCDGTHRNAFPEPLFQKDASRNGVLEPPFLFSRRYN